MNMISLMLPHSMLQVNAVKRQSPLRAGQQALHDESVRLCVIFFASSSRASVTTIGRVC